MITLDVGRTRFSYRVGGVCIYKDHVLLHRAATDSFWALPGGRCEMMEDSSETLRREMNEEIHLDVGVGRLLWIIENFSTHEGTQVHELGIYREFNLPDGCELLETSITYASSDTTRSGLHVPLEFKWFPLHEIPRTEIYPTVLRKELQQLPCSPRHIIHHGNADK